MVATRNLSQYEEMHRTRRYGTKGAKKLNLIEPWIDLRRPTSVLDYGAGRSDLVDRITCPSVKIRHRFDPAIPEIATIPLASYDMVVCTAVLEHVDEDEAPDVIADIQRVGREAILAISTRPAAATLPSGENAHSAVKPATWWLEQTRAHYPSAEIFFANEKVVYIKTWRSGLAERFRSWRRG